MKASFANWYLLFIDESGDSDRGNLSILYTLRNNSDDDAMATMRYLVKNNASVKNKDRQDPMSVLELTRAELTNFLSNARLIMHTIFPETVRFTEDNKIGMYTNPISVADL